MADFNKVMNTLEMLMYESEARLITINICTKDGKLVTVTVEEDRNG